MWFTSGCGQLPTSGCGQLPFTLCVVAIAVYVSVYASICGARIASAVQATLRFDFCITLPICTDRSPIITSVVGYILNILTNCPSFSPTNYGPEHKIRRNSASSSVRANPFLNFCAGMDRQGLIYTKVKTKEVQVTLYCPLAPPVTKQSAHAITLHDTDRRY